jgi:hypothetical protein
MFLRVYFYDPRFGPGVGLVFGSGVGLGFGFEVGSGVGSVYI